MKKNYSSKILLVYPPYYRLFDLEFSNYRYPLALGYLGAEIHSKTNWDVRALNLDFNPNPKPISIKYLSGNGFKNYLETLNNLDHDIWQQFILELDEYQPDVISIYCCTPNSIAVKNLTEISRRILPNSTVIIGGPHPTLNPMNVLYQIPADFAVIGEGERTIIELLYCIENSNDPMDVDGLVFIHNNRYIRTKERSLIHDLDELAFPHNFAESILIDFEKYPANAFSNIFTTRGCPYNCLFCGSKYIWGRKVRFRSVKNIVEEIRSLIKLGVDHIHFDDDTFGINKDFIEELCKGLKSNFPNLKWSCEIHVNLISEEIVRIMANSGCDMIQLGIESGNNEILKKIRKNITIQNAIDSINLINKYNIQTLAFFMIGFPEETVETLQDTFNAMKKVNSLISYSIFTPYPGTEAFDLCIKNGLIDSNYNPALYNHQSPENCFSMFIEKKKFRQIAEEMEKFVDHKNNSILKKKHCKNLINLNLIKKIINYFRRNVYPIC